MKEAEWKSGLLLPVFEDLGDVGVRLFIRPECEHRSRDVQTYSVHDDHPLRVANNPVAVLSTDDQMQSRPQDQRLSGDHRIPANSQEDHREPVETASRNVHELEQEAEGIWYNAYTGQEQGPEVKALEVFEGQEDDNDEFAGVVHCEASKEYDKYFERLTVAIVASGDSCAW